MAVLSSFFQMYGMYGMGCITLTLPQKRVRGLCDFASPRTFVKTKIQSPIIGDIIKNLWKHNCLLDSKFYYLFFEGFFNFSTLFKSYRLISQAFLLLFGNACHSCCWMSNEALKKWMKFGSIVLLSHVILSMYIVKLEKSRVTCKEGNSHGFFSSSRMKAMAIRVVEFSNGGYKIRKVFA